ncbi:MAG: hypothetical protein ACTSQS_17845, partial [Promethearchaeota archaeon]
SEKVLNVGSINPNQEYIQEYEVQNLKEPVLNVLEQFDTERGTADTINNAFLYETKNLCSIKLTLTNKISLPINDIKLTREMPGFLQEIEIKAPSSGNADLGEEDGKRVLIWTIDSLNAGESIDLILECSVIMQEKTAQSLGALKVTYIAEGHKLTMLNPEVRCLTDSMSGIDRDEGSSPGTWDCNVEFINESEFQVKLEEVKVKQNIPSGSEIVVSQTPNSTLAPNNSWDFDFQVESKNVPELESQIQFTALFKVITRVIGEINKESTIYDVLAAEIHKEINPPEVGAYANTEMEIKNIITNTGTASIETLKIFDEIPEDFIPPAINQIKIIVQNPENKYEIQERTEFIKKIEIIPEDQNPDSKHSITVRLQNLEKELPPNSKIIVNYPLMAKNPKPDVKYNTPVEMKGNTKAKGLYFKKSPTETPEIKIKYVKRKLKTLKSIKPGMSEGEFSITVRIQNKGAVELENIVVKDKIPKGFSLSTFTPPEGATHEVIQLGEESELQIKIPELKANEAISINYNCAGSGDYPRSEPQVVVVGRGELEASSTKPTESETISPAAGAQVQTISQVKHGEVLEIFTKIFKAIDQGLSSAQLANLIEINRDALPPGPNLHKLMAYARELKGIDKMIVGSFQEEVIKTLKEFKEKYVS